MDSPNNGPGAGSNSMSRAGIARELRGAAGEQRREALRRIGLYQPAVHEQIQRLFRNYEVPLYVRFRGCDRAQALALVESMVTSFATAYERHFSDSEAQALAEHSISSIHATMAGKWAVTGIAGYLTYRGRDTWRFPLYKPKLTGRFKPSASGPFVKSSWHTLRFAAYYCVTWLLAMPPYEAYLGLRNFSAMNKDLRLAEMLQDRQRALAEMAAPGSRFGAPGGEHEDSWNSESQTDRPTYPAEGDARSSIPAQAKAAWNTHRQPAQSQASPPEDSWGRLADDVDDASPVASSAQNRQGSPANYGGSAWDRIRQQSQHQPRRDRRQGQQQTGEEPPAADGGWGSTDDASSRGRGQRDSYSYSSSDEEKVVAKSQAQKEFDELLEKERRGLDQGPSSWSKK